MTNSKQPTESQVQEMAEFIQQETHKIVAETISSNNKISYQDATNVCVFKMIADLKLRITQLEKEETK